MKKKKLSLKLDKMTISGLNDAASSTIKGGSFFSGGWYCAAGTGGSGQYTCVSTVPQEGPGGEEPCDRES